MDATQIQAAVDLQKAFFNTHQTINVKWRKSQLRLLKESIQHHEREIQEALYLDLGKNADEAYMSEIGMTYAEINYMLRHMDCLSAVHYKYTPLHQFLSVSMTIDIPYGNVLIMSPWNYPFLLTMAPLTDCLAAGNTALVKPSDYSSHTSAVIQKIIAETFQPGYVDCITGGRAENQALLDQKFDYIFFTGSPTVGQLVMEKASAHLTPISLELGGKSPAVVDSSANLKMAARRIVFGKFLNAGQTCVAPDYVYVHESVKDDFLQILRHEIELQYPSPQDIGKIINEKHFKRLLGLINPSKVVYGGTASASTLQIAPTVMDHITWEDPVMQEEIFGPVLPILTFADFKQLMETIAARPTPLAFYLFTRNPEQKAWYKRIQPFGSGCINDTVVQLSNDHLPFGGMGHSGMGQYHGAYGFETFSHTKAVLDKVTWLDLPFRYHNQSGLAGKLIHSLLK